MIDFDEVYILFKRKTKMDYSKYENKLTYPKIPKKTCPNCNKWFEKGDNFCSKCGTEVNSYFEKMASEYKFNKQKYIDEDLRIRKEFKLDALKCVGLENHEKKDKIFEFAWNKGCSSGYRDVVEWLEELYDIVT